MTRDDVLTKLEQAGLGHYREQAMTLLVPDIILHATPTPENHLALGVSKLGGWPDLPAETRWPCDETAIPLNFLAQIDLADVHAVVPKTPLPLSGLLSFFSDDTELVRQKRKPDSMTFQVIYTPRGKVLKRHHFLGKATCPPKRFTSYAVRFSTWVTITPLFSEISMSNRDYNKLNAALPGQFPSGTDHPVLDDTRREKSWIFFLEPASSDAQSEMHKTSHVLSFYIHERDLVPALTHELYTIL